MTQTPARSKRFRALFGSVCLALYVGASLEASAQGIGLPVPVPSTAPPNVIREPLDKARDTVNEKTKAADRLLKRDKIGRPADPKLFDLDDRGNRVIRGEVLAVSPSRESLRIARSLKFSVSRERRLSGLDLEIVVLNPPEGLSSNEALKRLRAADPAGRYDLNHVFDPSGSADAKASGSDSANASGEGKSLGLVDGGIDQAHPAFRHAHIKTFNAVSRADPFPTEHGTAVASLLIGDDDGFQGALPGAQLYAADVFGGEARGGSAEAVARGLAWLAEKEVAVVTMSLAGPRNELIAATVQAMIKRGHVIVAAVGNDGPAAAPVYPAAIPGVVAVTSVDARRQLQLDAGRGEHVTFAALGVDIKAAGLEGGYTSVTGTSYAAPLIAGAIAREISEPDPALATQTIARFESRAIDLGTPGRDASFGYGLLEGESASTALSREAD